MCEGSRVWNIFLGHVYNLISSHKIKLLQSLLPYSVMYLLALPVRISKFIAMVSKKKKVYCNNFNDVCLLGQN